MYLCLCKGLTERDVDRCVEAGNCTAEALIATLGLDDAAACGRCRREIGQRGPAAWRGGASGAAGERTHGLSLIEIALAGTRPRVAEGLPACGVAACGAALCAACASRSLPAAGSPAGARR